MTKTLLLFSLIFLKSRLQLYKHTYERGIIVKDKYTLGENLKFIVPSLIGVFLFMTPVKYGDGFTIPVAVLADIVQDVLAVQLSLFMVIILLLIDYLIIVAIVT